MSYPKISIVTVNLNKAQFLEQTIQSVLNQHYPNLEYIIIDGGSNDGSVEIIKKYSSSLAYWCSEKDDGYGFALQKGFQISTGEIMAWLNSDDLHLPYSLFHVAEFFSLFPQINWLTGFPGYCSEKGSLIAEMPGAANSFLPKRHDLYLKFSSWSRCRFIGGDHSTIQQESTFWKRSLWEKAGSYISNEYSLAIDMELWTRFFRHEKLYTAPALFAAFRYGGSRQLSRAEREQYEQEAVQILKKEQRELSRMLKIKFSISRAFKPFYYLDIGVFNFFYERLMEFPAALDYDFSKGHFVLQKK